MIPLILITTNKRHIDKYIQTLKDKNAVVINIIPEKTEYSIAQIRSLTKETAVFHPELRIYLLSDFDRSSIEAQNAFLKLLEEPAEKTLFILTAKSAYSLLPTIISRSHIIRLDRPKITPDEIAQKQLEQLVEGKQFALFPANIDQMIFFFRTRLSTDRKATEILKEILRVKTLLENNNLNQQLAVDHLLIFIHKMYTMKI